MESLGGAGWLLGGYWVKLDTLQLGLDARGAVHQFVCSVNLEFTCEV